MTRALVLLAIVGLIAVSPAQANVIYSNFASPINGDQTPSLGYTPNFTTVVHFAYTPGDSGVVVSEIGQPTVNTGWHDAQVEVSAAGQVDAAVWAGYLATINLGAATPGDNTVVYSYNDTLGKLFGSLDGAPFVTLNVTRQDPVSNGGASQIWAFGVPDTTTATTGLAYSNTISSVVISNIGLVPEPSSFVLLGLSGIGLLVAGRRIRTQRA